MHKNWFTGLVDEIATFIEILEDMNQKYDTNLVAVSFYA